MCKQIIGVALALALFSVAIVAQYSGVSNEQLAKRLVKSASVKPGDVVVIDGGKHMVPLMEAVAVEVWMSGGLPTMILETDRAQRAQMKDMPEKYLEQEPRFFAEWLKNANVYISLPSVEDMKGVFGDIPAERSAKADKAGHFFGDLLNSLPLRLVSLDMPTKEDADRVGMNFDDYQKLMSEGMNANYDAIAETGRKVETMIKTGKELHITTPAGTDFTVKLAGSRPVLVDDGIVTEEEARSTSFLARTASLPSGSIFFAPLESTAQGKVFVQRANCRYGPYDKVSFDMKDGKMLNLNSYSNQNCVAEYDKNNSGQADMLGGISIGLNPGLRVVEDGKANFRNGNIAGIVRLNFGDNRIFGGTLDSVGGHNYTLTNATVMIDGKTVVKDGKVAL
jgi:aminopeptidase